MKNQNLSFNPAEYVSDTITVRKFLVIGKPVSEFRRYFNGKWEFISPKRFAKEQADQKRAAEDAALAATVAEKAQTEMLRKAQNAFGRLDPNYKAKASKLLIASTESLVAIEGKAQVLAVKADELGKTISAAELLIKES